MLTYGVVLLHDNAHSHGTRAAGAFQFGIVWPHPDSPELGPDYHLLTYLNIWLRSQHDNGDGELIEGVKT
jgi:hypothetical protein